MIYPWCSVLFGSCPFVYLFKMIVSQLLECSEYLYEYIDDFVQDCGNSITNALELLQPCTKPPKLSEHKHVAVKMSDYRM